MQIDKKQLIQLDTEVYSFSVKVISFIKTLEKFGFYEHINSKTLQVAGRMTTEFPDYNNIEGNLLREKFKELSLNTAECFELLQKIECKSIMLDEKSNLIIEANSIIKQIDEVIV